MAQPEASVHQTSEPDIYPVQNVLYVMKRAGLDDETEPLYTVAEAVMGNYSTDYEATLDHLRPLVGDPMLTAGQRAVLERMYREGVRAEHEDRLEDAAAISNEFLAATPGAVQIDNRVKQRTEIVGRIIIGRSSESPEASLRALTDEGSIAFASMRELFCRAAALSDLAQRAVRAGLRDK